MIVLDPNFLYIWLQSWI